jgi:hypothetical protein
LHIQHIYFQLSLAASHYLRANLNFQRNEHSICRNRFRTLQGSITHHSHFPPSAGHARWLFKPGAIFPRELRLFRQQNKYRRARIVNESFSCTHCALGSKQKLENTQNSANEAERNGLYRSGRWLTSRVCRGSFITRSQQAPTSQAAANTPGVYGELHPRHPPR